MEEERRSIRARVMARLESCIDTYLPLARADEDHRAGLRRRCLDLARREVESTEFIEASHKDLFDNIRFRISAMCNEGPRSICSDGGETCFSEGESCSTEAQQAVIDEFLRLRALRKQEAESMNPAASKKRPPPAPAPAREPPKKKKKKRAQEPARTPKRPRLSQLQSRIDIPKSIRQGHASRSRLVTPDFDFLSPRCDAGTFEAVFAPLGGERYVMERVQAHKRLFSAEFCAATHAERVVMATEKLQSATLAAKYFDAQTRENISTMLFEGQGFFTTKQSCSEVNYILLLIAILGESATFPVKYIDEDKIRNRSGVLVNFAQLATLFHALSPAYINEEKDGNALRFNFLIRITGARRCASLQFKDTKSRVAYYFIVKPPSRPGKKKFSSKGNKNGSPYDLLCELKAMDSETFDRFCEDDAFRVKSRRTP